ncbi:serine hydrolase [Ignatzschineria larvae DSM 13226]|uniref:Serine hydrolase n=1 Tax=Ignatzschineria larvae DSM 13226 TaxID=1111732 RepID=A0ABZ3C453_9GAMM|nr:serine hydrolase [Ignatzschineria larvae]
MWRHITENIEESLSRGFPGGQLLLELSGEVIYERNFGSQALTQCQVVDDQLQVARGAPVTEKTLFDIASLTKIFATTYLFQYYAKRDPKLLTQRIVDFWPDMLSISSNKSIANITIEMFLSHHAGFEPNPLFYDPKYDLKLYCQNRTSFLTSLLQAPLIHPPGAQGLYSDVDFMLLTFILERYAEKSIEHQLSEIFWEPLELCDILYKPLDSGRSFNTLAATERYGNTRDGLISFPNIRTEMIQGEVQDEKAYHCMDGISGHAGLFANARTLLSLFRLMYQPNDYFNEVTINRFLTPPFSDPTFGLGWRLNGPDMCYMFGDEASLQSFGHTGWTGCLVMRDPKIALTMIYLTNRKNTPVINPAENQHLFYGDRLPAGRYLNMIQAIYQDLAGMGK